MSALRSLSFVALVAMTGSAFAAEVTEKIDIAASPAATWSAIGDFCGIKNWHPVIAGCELMTDGGDKVRTLTTKDGAKFVEKQLAWDDAGKSYTYAIVTSPLPLKDYKSTIMVTGSGDKSTITWTGSFTPNEAGNGVEKVVTSIYQAGLGGLKTKLEGK